MKDLCDIIKSINDNMENLGFTQKITIESNNMTITEEEVIIKMPYELTIKIPKNSFGEGCSIKKVVNKAISQAISLPVRANK